MRLQAKPPTRMLQDASHRLGRVQTRTRLKEEMSGRQLLVTGQVLPFVHHLYFVHTRQPQLSTLLGRTSHPVDVRWKRTDAVGFDADVFSCLVQTVDKRLVDPQRRFATRQNHRPRCRRRTSSLRFRAAYRKKSTSGCSPKNVQIPQAYPCEILRLAGYRISR